MLWSQTYLLKLFILTEKDIEMLQNINSLVEEEVSMNIKMMKSLCRSTALPKHSSMTKFMSLFSLI